MNAAQELQQHLVQAQQAFKSGQLQQAVRLWQQVLAADPNNLTALNMLGEIAFRSGDLMQAKVLLERLTQADGKDSQQWVNLALVHQGLKDEAGEEQALFRALCVAPNDLLALILRADLLERQGKMHQAAKAHSMVIGAAPPMESLNPSLRPAVAKSMEFKERHDKEFGEFLDQKLAAVYKNFGASELSRFKDSVDIMLGRKRRFDSLPAIYYFPNLAPIEFFERDEFPWLEALESATDSIRTEFLAVHAEQVGFAPYLNYPDDVEKHQFAELNKSLQWSAFHLYESGKRVERNAAKCPLTIQALDACPQPQQAGRTPTAMFSLLKPKTHIPPHVGVTNARLVTHLPLIVPDHCGFRVGNKTREWVPGKAWVFDDTIEHEAWNQSDELRVVLIFDVWHPHLTTAERALISAMAGAFEDFSSESGQFEL